MNSNHFLELKIPPPVLFLAFAGLMWLLSFLIPRLSFHLSSRALPLALAAVSGLFAGPSIWSFFRAKTTILPEKPNKTTTLVVKGVYALSRNPMYLALLFLLIGWAIYLGNFLSIIPVPFFVIYLNRFQIRPEEQALTKLFGQEYEAYTKRVRRWL